MNDDVMKHFHQIFMKISLNIFSALLPIQTTLSLCSFDRIIRMSIILKSLQDIAAHSIWNTDAQGHEVKCYDLCGWAPD